MASKLEKVGPSQTYQRFAWVTLALAGLVALFSADRSEPAGAGAPAELAQGVTAPAPAKLVQQAVNPPMTAPLAEPESDESGDQAGGDSGDDQAAPQPSLADAEAKPRAAGPSSPNEAGQLMASSRNRSGGIDQGDEPVRRSPAP